MTDLFICKPPNLIAPIGHPDLPLDLVSSVFSGIVKGNFDRMTARWIVAIHLAHLYWALVVQQICLIRCVSELFKSSSCIIIVRSFEFRDLEETSKEHLHNLVSAFGFIAVRVCEEVSLDLSSLPAGSASEASVGSGQQDSLAGDEGLAQTETGVVQETAMSPSGM